VGDEVRTSEQAKAWTRLARLRVPLGFACSAVAFWLAHPSTRSITVGGMIAAAGELIRLWASGHLEKAREVTRSGPYRFARHPLYLGSSIIAIGLIVAAASASAAVLITAYCALTLTAAIRIEDSWLRERFGEEYDAYRAGRAEASMRRFSFGRVIRNGEHRAVAGLLGALALLAVKAALAN
jgi:protein-S-isoprenylcysteine O-methyltransferase Ste14